MFLEGGKQAAVVNSNIAVIESFLSLTRRGQYGKRN
jgi:hypothetical protein